MGKNILGLDIKKTEVSAVLINSSLKASSIEAFTYVPITQQEEMDKGVAAALQVLQDNMDLAGSMCVASFPADRISFRNVTVPFKQPKKIRQILPFELEPTLPHAVEDLIIDFEVVNTHGPEDQTNLFTAAIDVSSLKDYLELLATYGIEPEIVTVGGYPIALCLAKLADIPENAMFVEMDNEKNTLSAFISGQICLIRSFPTISEGTSRLESLCKNIQRTIHAFEDTTGLVYKPDTIFVTGSNLGENGFEKNVAQELDIPTQRADLAGVIKLKLENHPLPSWNPSKMDSALALALIEVAGLRGLNFRKGPFAIAKRWVEHKQNLVRTGILAAVVLLFALVNISLDFYGKQQKLDTPTPQVDQILKQSFPDVKPGKDIRAQIRKKKDNALRASLSSDLSAGNHRFFCFFWKSKVFSN